MNDLAVESIGPVGLSAAVPPAELAPGLRSLVSEGVVRRGGVLVFARDVHRAEVTHGTPDLTAWECSVSSFHLDDVVPVDVRLSEDGEPVISEDDQVVMLRHGLGFALEIVRLVREMPEQVEVRCILSANSTNGTFRFHRARPAESWLNDDLDAYTLDKMIVVDSRPSGSGGTSW